MTQQFQGQLAGLLIAVAVLLLAVVTAGRPTRFAAAWWLVVCILATASALLRLSQLLH